MSKHFAWKASTLSIALAATVMTVSACASANADTGSLSTPTPAPVVVASAAPTPAPTAAPKAKKEKKQHREYQAAFSKKAKDLVGYEKSLYQGKYYYPDQEGWRKCVMWRESNYRYNLIGAGYNWPYHGAYQFHNVNWKNGLTYMMAGESKKTKDGLRGEARKLRFKDIHQWNRYWQDRALFTALNYNGKYSGAHHWATTNGGC